MQTIPLYETTGISGYKIKRIRLISRNGKEVEMESEEECKKAEKREERLINKGSGGRRHLVISIQRKDAVCPHCGSEKAMYYKENVRLIQCQGFGRIKTYIEVDIHRIYCPECHKMKYEHLEFLSNPRARITRAFEKKLIESRKEMSITSVSKNYDVAPKIVREAEIRALEHKYARVSLKGIKRIGIDEIYIFHLEKKGKKFITIVRDLDTGRVINVSRGKGEDALKMFASRLKRFGNPNEIECVTMDMSNAYANFVAHNFPNACIVYDHFHIIKMLNDMVNKVRRATVAKLNAETYKELHELNYSKLEKNELAKIEREIRDKHEKAKKVLKGNMRLLLLNKEDVEKSSAAKDKLDKMLAEHIDLNTAWTLKEVLRSIYNLSKNVLEAKGLLENWIIKAKSSGVKLFERMSVTIEKHLEGILGFWKFHGLSNAHIEGFNNKIRWLIRQAYGYRNYRYFRLKIFDLPNIKLSRNDY